MSRKPTELPLQNLSSYNRVAGFGHPESGRFGSRRLVFLRGCGRSQPLPWTHELMSAVPNAGGGLTATTRHPALRERLLPRGCYGQRQSEWRCSTERSSERRSKRGTLLRCADGWMGRAYDACVWRWTVAIRVPYLRRWTSSACPRDHRHYHLLIQPGRSVVAWKRKVRPAPPPSICSG